MSHILSQQQFSVATEPRAFLGFMQVKENWLKIIPGCKKGSVTSINEEGDWLLKGNFKYTFSDHASEVKDDGSVLFSYSVHVKGKLMGMLPLDFKMDVTWDVKKSVEDPNTSVVERTILNFKSFKCSALKKILKRKLRSKIREENKTIKRMLDKS